MRNIQPDCIEFNPSSTQQLQQLLFAPFKKKATGKQPKHTESDDDDDPMKIKKVFKTVVDFPEYRSFKVEKLEDHDYNEPEGSKKLKYREMTVKGLGIPAKKMNLSGIPSVDTSVLIDLQSGIIEKFFK